MAIDMHESGLREIILASDSVPKHFYEHLRFYMPDLRIYHRYGSMKKWLLGYEQKGNQLTIYLCSNGRCSLPMNSLDQLIKELQKSQPTN
ncbi:MAG: hypothetical protein ACP5NC_01230 [Nitrososphaeria archaeon]